MEWYMKVLKNYATFTGRARRKEYWMFYLFYIIFFVVAVILDVVIGSFPLFYMVYLLGLLLPSLAVSVRRLHDVGASGWFLFISLIPLIGGIILLVKMCTEGTPGQNQYGMNPKESV